MKKIKKIDPFSIRKDCKTISKIGKESEKIKLCRGFIFIIAI